MCAYAVEIATGATSLCFDTLLIKLMKGVACQSSFLNWDFAIPSLRMLRALITILEFANDVTATWFSTEDV